MFENTFSSRTRFPVLIDENLELGIINHLSYKLDLGHMDKNISGPEKFVSGGFRFTDLNTDLIYKLCDASRFSTLLVDGDRVFQEDTNGLNEILLKIRFPNEVMEDVLTPVENSDILTAPISIIGVSLIATPIYNIQIGKYYNYNAHSILFIGQNGKRMFKFSIS
jgi:hypothetical protein